MNGPVEKKVALTGVAGAVVTGVFGTLAWLAPGVGQPPAALIALYVTIAGFVVGYIAPHTSRGLSPAEVALLDQVRRKPLQAPDGPYTDPVKVTPPAQPPAGTAP